MVGSTSKSSRTPLVEPTTKEGVRVSQEEGEIALEGRRVSNDNPLCRVEITRNNQVVVVDTFSIEESTSDAEVDAGLRALQKSVHETQLRLDMSVSSGIQGALFVCNHDVDTLVLRGNYNRSLGYASAFLTSHETDRGREVGGTIKSLVLEQMGADHCATLLASLLRGNPESLEKVTVRNIGTGLRSDRRDELESACLYNRSVKKLHLDGWAGSRCSYILLQNLAASLTELQLTRTSLGEEDCAMLVRALQMYRYQSLRKIYFGEQFVIRTGLALVWMDEMIRAAGFIETAHFWTREMHTRQFKPLFRTYRFGWTHLKCIELSGLRAPNLDALAECLSSVDDKRLVELKIFLWDLDEISLFDFTKQGIVRNNTLKSLELGVCMVPLQRLPYDAMLPVLEQLQCNLTLTDIQLSNLTEFANVEERKEQSEKLSQIARRNQELERLDYGMCADPRIWPRLIEICLPNKWFGPSLVFRLLSSRPGEIDTCRPGEIDTGYDSPATANDSSASFWRYVCCRSRGEKG